MSILALSGAKEFFRAPWRSLEVNSFINKQGKAGVVIP
jgi:hypothetical protein